MDPNDDIDWEEELAQDAPSDVRPLVEETCTSCGGHISLVDPAFVCSNDCTYCLDCQDSLGGSCKNCGEPLHQRPRRTQPIRPLRKPQRRDS